MTLGRLVCQLGWGVQPLQRQTLEKVVNHDIFERSVSLEAEKSHDALPVTAKAFGMSASTP